MATAEDHDIQKNDRYKPPHQDLLNVRMNEINDRAFLYDILTDGYKYCKGELTFEQELLATRFGTVDHFRNKEEIQNKFSKCEDLWRGLDEEEVTQCETDNTRFGALNDFQI